MNIDEIFKRDDEVRDNETDLQGIVNNANYFIYMAHTRHKHLKALGVDFAETFQQGYSLVVAEATIKYRIPLIAGDEYTVTSKIASTSKIRIMIEHEVIRKSDGKISATGVITCTSINLKTGRPSFSENLKKLLNIP